MSCIAVYLVKPGDFIAMAGSDMAAFSSEDEAEEWAAEAARKGRSAIVAKVTARAVPAVEFTRAKAE